MMTAKTITVTKGISRRDHVRVESEEGRTFTPLAAFTAAVFCIMIVLVFSFLNAAYQDAREQYVELLNKERQVVEINKALNTELMAMSQKGYIEFVAQERLGLKKPTDQEVVVLR
jgi:hypothetical protein